VFLQKVEEALAENQQQRALLLSLRLNEDSLIKKCVFAVDPSNVRAICSSVPFKYLQRLIDAFADLLESCPHLEFILLWAQVPFAFILLLLMLMHWILSYSNISFPGAMQG
jgi:periodic tryptophan protein 2